MRSYGLEYVRSLLATGRYSFTRAEASGTIKRKGSALNKILQRLQRAGWIHPLGKSFFIIIDPQNKAMGSIPPAWFMDAWAHHRGVEYYVGGLSAAEWHGAAHQRPQIFQVVVNQAIRGFKLASGQVQLLFRHKMNADMWELKKVPTGFVHVSTPEMTAYDLLSLRTACPSLDHAATVYVELGSAMKASKIASLTKFGDLATLQRMGWLLDRTGWASLSAGLAQHITRQTPVWTPLQASGLRQGPRNTKWHIIENTDVQPDLEPGEPI